MAHGSTVSKRPDDDMHDSLADFQRPDPLGRFLQVCDPAGYCKLLGPQGDCPPPEEPDGRRTLTLYGEYRAADAKAIEGQERYRSLTRGVAWLGTVALGLLVLELTIGAGLNKIRDEPKDRFFSRLEQIETSIPFGGVLSATFCCALVGLGLLLYRHERYLADRYRAERLRLLKFQTVIDPEFWLERDAGESRWSEQFERDIEDICKISHDDVESLKFEEDLPPLPPGSRCRLVAPADLESLVSYYTSRRLKHQTAYFFGKLKRPLSLIDNPRLLPIFFFGGVFLAVLNYLLRMRFFATPLTFLVALGAALAPVIWTGVRTARSAYENARNLSRSRSRHSALLKLGKHLHEATAGPSHKWDPQSIFTYLYLSELVLAADQREWIRLMKDSEWYG